MSIPDWLPGVDRFNGADAGPMLPGSKWSLLLHTTEGPTLVGAISALRAKSAWSHFIFDPNTGQLVQAVSMNRAAKSLRSGGNYGKTNAARVIQVEIVGSANDTPNWSPQRNAAVGRMIARIHEVVPFRVEMPLGFYGNGAGWIVASSKARQRMSWVDWYRFDAICGHQHAPSNDHWDPGAINTVQILAAARGNTPAPQPAAHAAPAHASGVSAPAGVPSMRRGATGQRVRELQVALNFGIGARLAGDGQYGPAVEHAVKNLQLFFHLSADGVYGPKSQLVLQVACNARG